MYPSSEITNKLQAIPQLRVDKYALFVSTEVFPESQEEEMWCACPFKIEYSVISCTLHRPIVIFFIAATCYMEKKFSDGIYMFGCGYMSVCATVYVVPVNVRRICQIFWRWCYKLSCRKWKMNLGLKEKSVLLTAELPCHLNPQVW